MILTFNGRLPGVVCEAALPAAQEMPLRLDVAAFVGFAERGPLDQPVAVEDISQYRAVFGGDLLLARQRPGNQPVYANLPQAVRAFFDNGGRRCYVVRVAGQDARPNRFRFPGLVTWHKSVGEEDPVKEEKHAKHTRRSRHERKGIQAKGEEQAQGEEQVFQAVIAPAAWVGRWSDSMSIGTQLHSTPLSIRQTLAPSWDHEAKFYLEVPTPATVRSGDLLRLQFDGAGKPFVFCTVDGVERTDKTATAPQGIPVTVKVQPGTLLAFTFDPGDQLPKPTLVEHRHQHAWRELPLSVMVLTKVGDIYHLHIEGQGLDRVQEGNVLRISCEDGETLIFIIDSVEFDENNVRSVNLTCSTPRWNVQVKHLTEAGWSTLKPSAGYLDALSGGDKGYKLYLPGTTHIQAGDILRVAYGSDKVLFFPVSYVVDLHHEKRDHSRPEYRDLWQAESLETVPLEVSSQTAMWEMPDPLPASYGKLVEVDLLSFDLVVREGLETEEVWSELRFSPGPNYWLDTLVAPVQPNMLLSATSQRNIPGLDPTRSSRLGVPSTDGSSTPLYLPLGMAELLDVETFARPLPDPPHLRVNPLCPLASKDGLESFEPVTLFLDSRLAQIGVRDLLDEVNQLLYLNSGTTVEPIKKLHSLLPIDEIGLIALPDLVSRHWECERSEERKEHKHGPNPERDWSHFQRCRPLPSPDLKPPPLCNTSVYQGWTPRSLAVQMELPDPRQQLNALPLLEEPDQYTTDGLLQVQQALIRLCAARADVLAALSLPQHFQQRDVLEWQRGLTTGLPDLLESSVLSYAAVYHPWLQVREEMTPELAPLRATPPDGAVCGMIAARELARGPWIAPANVPLRGVVGLTPSFTTDDWVALFNAQVNLVRQRPGQFTLLSAHTLSVDSQFLQISVRRLLIYLRKLVLQRGMQYVFESNNERFRQRVQASFEYTLTVMTARGGLSAFEVDTGGDINTPADFDNGRFLIALKIAPTQPVEFITIVLLRTGEGLLEVVER